MFLTVGALASEVSGQAGPAEVMRDGGKGAWVWVSFGVLPEEPTEA